MLKRIQRSRLQLTFIKLHRKAYADADYKETAEKFIAEVKRHGIEFIQEGRDLERSFAQIRTGCLPDASRTFWDPQPISEG